MRYGEPIRIDFRDELDKMRAAYHRHPLRFRRIPRPRWLTEEDGLAQVYRDRPLLYRHGEVYYAQLIQANMLLFSPGKDDCPADILCTNHPAAEEEPRILAEMAHELYSYKNQPEEQIPPHYREAVRCITAETERLDLAYPAYVDHESGILSDTGEVIEREVQRFQLTVQLRSILVVRRELPGGVLRGKILPILAAPQHCRPVMLLPLRYWSPGFRRFYEAQ